jgi:hypothetical protein
MIAIKNLFSGFLDDCKGISRMKRINIFFEGLEKFIKEFLSKNTFFFEPR